MAMVRKNPLPPGRYWIFIQKNSQDIFDLWLKKNADVVSVERKESDGAVWPIMKANETFYVFNVKEATIWPRGVGFPNDANAPATGTSVKTPADVTTRGPVPTAKDVLKDIEETASEGFTSGLTLAIIVGAIILMVRK